MKFLDQTCKFRFIVESESAFLVHEEFWGSRNYLFPEGRLSAIQGTPCRIAKSQPGNRVAQIL
jgi:hypothetical protein